MAHDNVKAARTPERSFQRLTLYQRIQHWIMLGTFTLLALTGLPMRFPDVAWLGGIYSAVGGLVVARAIHRAAALLMVGDGL
ncbi:MAG TPA: hypothetical protein VF832_05960, partial [Longimicrobiales bacterium]